MREAVSVSTARTPIGRACRGAFNRPIPGGHTIWRAVQGAGPDARSLFEAPS